MQLPKISLSFRRQEESGAMQKEIPDSEATQNKATPIFHGLMGSWLQLKPQERRLVREFHGIVTLLNDGLTPASLEIVLSLSSSGEMGVWEREPRIVIPNISGSTPSLVCSLIKGSVRREMRTAIGEEVETRRSHIENLGGSLQRLRDPDPIRK